MRVLRRATAAVQRGVLRRWLHDDVTSLPVVTDTVTAATEMRDCYDRDVQLLADPDGEVADRPDDRTVGIRVRSFLRNDDEDVFGE